jgi:hypothetical protein
MDVNSADKWEMDYQRGGDGWDLGGPNPVFRSLIESGQISPGKMIVNFPGTGSRSPRLILLHLLRNGWKD